MEGRPLAEAPAPASVLGPGAATVHLANTAPVAYTKPTDVGRPINGNGRGTLPFYQHVTSFWLDDYLYVPAPGNSPLPGVLPGGVWAPIYAWAAKGVPTPTLGVQLADADPTIQQAVDAYWVCPKAIGNLTITGVGGYNGEIDFTSTGGVRGSLDTASGKWLLTFPTGPQSSSPLAVTTAAHRGSAPQ